MLSHPRLVTATVALAAVAALGACGTGAGDGIVTVTSSGAATSSPSATASEAGPPTSEDRGRRYDFGRIARITEAGGTQVLAFDRWTDPTVDDAVLAQKGLPVTPYAADKVPYENLNTTNTFAVPVRDGAMFLLHHCIAAGDPLQARSVSAQELLDADPRDTLVLLTIDPDGYATGGETFAGC